MFLAVLIGLSLGLFITYGIYTARTAGRQVNPNASASPNPSGDPEANNSNLAIISPMDESVHTTPDLSVTGTTIANAFVVIFVNDEELLTTSDVSGNFSVETKLEAGSNIIAVHVIDEDGKTSTLERTVVYITEAMQNVGTAQPASGSATRTSPRPSSTPATR